MLFAQQQRLNILKNIKKMFIEADKKGVGLEKEKLICEISSIFGSTRKKALEYIQELLNTKFIEEDEFGLWLKDKSYILAEIAEADMLLRGGTDGIQTK